MPDNKIQNIADEIKDYKPHTFEAIFKKGLEDMKVPFPEKVAHYLNIMFENARFTSDSSFYIENVEEQADKYLVTFGAQPFSYIEINDVPRNMPENGRLENIEVNKDPDNPFFYMKVLWAPYDKTLPVGYEKPGDEEYMNNFGADPAFPDRESGDAHKGYVAVAYVSYGNYSEAMFGNNILLYSIEEDLKQFGIGGLKPNKTYSINNTQFTTNNEGRAIIKDGVKFAETFNTLKESLIIQSTYEGKFKDYLTLTKEAQLPKIDLYYRFNKPTVFDPYFFISPGILNNNGNYWNSITNRYYEPLTIKYLGKTITLPVGQTSEEFNGRVDLDYLKSIPADATEIKVEITNEFKYPWVKEVHHAQEAELLNKDFFRNNYGLKFFGELDSDTYKFENSGVKAKYNNQVLEEDNFPSIQKISKKDFFKILKATIHEENYIEFDADIEFNYDYNTKLKLDIGDLNGYDFLPYSYVPGHDAAFQNKFNIKKLAIKNTDTDELLDTFISDGKEFIYNTDIYKSKYRFYKNSPSSLKVMIADDDNKNRRLSEKILLNYHQTRAISGTPHMSFVEPEKISLSFHMPTEADKEWFKDNYVLDIHALNKQYNLTLEQENFIVTADNLWKKILVNSSPTLKLISKNHDEKLVDFEMQADSLPHIGNFIDQILPIAKNIIFPVVERWQDGLDYIKFYEVQPSSESDSATSKENAVTIQFNEQLSTNIKKMYFIDVIGRSHHELSFEDGPVSINSIKAYRSGSFDCTAIINYQDKDGAQQEKEFLLDNVANFAGNSNAIIIFNNEGF